MTEIAVSACIDRNPYWDWHLLMRESGCWQRGCEVHCIHLDSYQMGIHHAERGRKDGIRVDMPVPATWLQGQAIVNWLRSQHKETPEELAERYLTLGELIR